MQTASHLYPDGVATAPVRPAVLVRSLTLAPLKPPPKSKLGEEDTKRNPSRSAKQEKPTRAHELSRLRMPVAALGKSGGGSALGSMKHGERISNLNAALQSSRERRRTPEEISGISRELQITASFAE